MLVASMVAQAMAMTTRTAITATGVPLRTLRRWGVWWRDTFPRLRVWAELRARFVPPPPNEADLPRSLVERLNGESAQVGAAERTVTPEALLLAARYLAPGTTTSVPEGSRFVMAAIARVGAP